MKKNTALVRMALILNLAAILLIALFFSACARVITDPSDELVMNRWQAEYDTGVAITLRFEDENAVFTVKTSDGKQITLSGVCVLSPTDFVICDESSGMNYRFGYTVHGDSLELERENSTIILEKLC